MATQARTGLPVDCPCTGAIMPEAISAYENIIEDIGGAGLLAITSADRIHVDWIAARRARISGKFWDRGAHRSQLLAPLSKNAAIITICDAHSSTLGWLGSVAGHRIYPLGVDIIWSIRRPSGLISLLWCRQRCNLRCGCKSLYSTARRLKTLYQYCPTPMIDVHPAINTFS